MTSLELNSDDSTYIVACCDTTNKDDDIWFFEVPKIKAHFNGSGDLFAALLLDILVPSRSLEVNYPSNHIPLHEALGQTLWLVNEVLERTFELARPLLVNGENVDQEIPKIKDLRLIQCRALFALDCIPSLTPTRVPSTVV